MDRPCDSDGPAKLIQGNNGNKKPINKPLEQLQECEASMPSKEEHEGCQSISQNGNDVLEEKDSRSEVIPEIQEESHDEMIELENVEKTLTQDEKKARLTEALELKGLGNDSFKKEEYIESSNKYTQAIRICPVSFKSERAVLYANRAAAKLKLHKSFTDSAIADCTTAAELQPSYLKARLRRASAYLSSDKLDEAQKDIQFILQVEPLNREAVSMYKDVQEKIAERDKKLQEMFGQLKQLGNMVLRPFGMSTDNFRVERDPVTSSYSVQFVQNANQGENSS